MSCSHIQTCELFVQFALNPALEIWQKHYCHDANQSCARYQLSKSGKPVPLTLLPNGKKIHMMRSNNELGITALFNCIAKDRARMAKSLILTGIDLNDSNVEGTTPLMAAAEQGSKEIVELFLKHGASKDLINMHGQTAYDLAVEKGHKAIAQILSADSQSTTGAK
ncbi:MAG: ankyrin repeat domain-containing protein [Kangiellaceae bacterium]|jgi:ankyrin repeat protein|nr:ankyrin repeat domain-containing protein [Kangiellaceae bacterium]